MKKNQQKGLPELPETNDSRGFWKEADTNLIDMDNKESILLDVDSITDFTVDFEKRQIYSKAKQVGFSFLTHQVEIKDGYLFVPYRDKVVRVRL